MVRARIMIFPSESYESFALTITEAFARGLPVVASRLDDIDAAIDKGRADLKFVPGKPSDSAAKAKRAWEKPT